MADCLFKRPHHQAIAEVLGALNADLLAESGCYFGGGTAIALRYGEFRESVDIDFLVSDLTGYRSLRQAIKEADCLVPITKDGCAIRELRDEVRSNGYSIQTLVGSSDVEIKFEIVLEARISFEQPGLDDQICGVPCLTPLDLMTSKLLANCDRWRDDSVFSRDLIDMAMMESPALLPAAIKKAEVAYGTSVRRDLQRAIEQLFQREGWLERCLAAMKMDVPKALLWKRVKALEASLSKKASVSL